MNRLARRTVVAVYLAGSAWLVGPGPRLAPGGATVQEPAKSGISGQAAPPGGRSQTPVVPEDDDEAAMREALVRRSLLENCLICHTEDIIAGQRLTPAQWKAEVEKMVNWGAPLPKEAEVSLTDYLARRYSDRTEPSAPARATLADVNSMEVPGPGRDAARVDGDPERGARLYATNCATCHGPTALGGDLGPSLAGKAILAHPREYDQIMKQGLRRMPGFQAVMGPKDQGDVLAWLRGRTYPE